MPGGDRVGEAYVDIHVNAAPGEAELAAFRAKAERDFAELGRQKAEAALTLKATDFDAKIDKAKKELDNIEHQKARASVELDKAKFDAEAAEVKAEIKELSKEKATVNVDLKQLRAANKEQRLLSKGRELDEKATLAQAKAERAVAKERERSIRDVQRQGQVEARARAENAKRDVEAIDGIVKQRAEIARLSESYEKLRGRQVGLEKSQRRVFSAGSIGQAEREARKLERVSSEAELVKRKIESLGGSVEDLDPQISKNSSLLDRWLSRLGDTSIRIGPLTTSIKGLGIGLGLLGPMLFEVGGAAVSLAGTLGEGLAGGAAVGAGALGGFAASAAGVGLVIAPMVSEFKEAISATQALHKAEVEYGKGSTQVKSAQEKVNHTLKGVSPIAREAVEDYGSLTGEWKKMTKAARPAVFNAFGEGLKTVQSLLPKFARESTKTTEVAGKAWDGWMKSLRSSEAKNLLGQVMGDFRASIPSLAKGLGSLAAMIGRIGAAGAHFLPGLSNGFAEWANNLEQAVGGGRSLTSSIGHMVSQLQSLGHLSQDTGSLLVHIFDASADSGQGLVKSLDGVIRGWDRWSQSAEGKSSLANFFEESKGATEDLMSSLGHFTELLFQFSRATAPVANGLLKVITLIGDIVSAGDQLVGVKQIFQGIGIVLGGVWAAGKVIGYADAIKGVAVRLGLMSAATSEDAAATSALTAAVDANTEAMVANAAAAGDMEVALGAGGAARGAEEAGTALEGAAEAGGLFAAAMSPEILVPAAAVAALVGLGVVLHEDRRTLSDVRGEFRDAGKQISAAMDDSSHHIDKYVASQHRAVAANHAAADARAHLVKLQKENAGANKITQAVEALNDAEREQTQTAHQTAVVNKKQISDQKDLIQGAEKRVKTGKELIKDLEQEVKNDKQLQSEVAGGGEVYKHENELAKAKKRLVGVSKELVHVQNEEAVTAIPYQRQLKELAPISQQAEAGLRKLVGTIGRTATSKIGNFVNPKDVEQIANLGNRLTKLGRGSQVKNIAVKSQGADQTIAKLQRLQKQTNRVEAARATIKVGANDAQAQSKLKRLSALSQKVTGSKNTIAILANSSNAEQAIKKLRDNLDSVAKKKYRAEVSAVDRTQPGWEAAYHNLREVASKKYEARINAVDHASSVAKNAESAAKKAGQQHPKINITATNEQALGAISAVSSALANLHDKTVNVNVVTHKGGNYGGGPSVYTPFAAGGMSDREMQRAQERAILKESRGSQKIHRPTMLVGEQAPQHPEYVIATNPAYREQNRRYLEQAAGDLGYDAIPAYKKGKGRKKSSGGGAAASSSHTPPKPKHRPHKIAKVTKWGPVAAYNSTETDAQVQEEDYSQVFSHDESEIRAKRMSDWEWGRLKGFLSQQAADYRTLNQLVPKIQSEANKKIKEINSEVDGNGAYSKSTIRKLNHNIGVESAKLSKLKKGKNESDASFRKRKRPFERAKTKIEKEKHHAEKERANLTSIRQEAKQEVAEVSGGHKINENKIAAERSDEELKYIEDVETGVVEAPYAESAGGGESAEMEEAKAAMVKAELEHNVAAEQAAHARMLQIAEKEYNTALTTPGYADDIEKGEQLKQIREETESGHTSAEETASLSDARQQLYEQFASNITAAASKPNPMAAAAASLTASGAAAASYGPFSGAAKLQTMFETQPKDKPATINNIVNNFAAPPPDPHTWTKQQQFEIGALA